MAVPLPPTVNPGGRGAPTALDKLMDYLFGGAGIGASDLQRAVMPPQGQPIPFVQPNPMGQPTPQQNNVPQMGRGIMDGLWQGLDPGMSIEQARAQLPPPPQPQQGAGVQGVGAFPPPRQPQPPQAGPIDWAARGAAEMAPIADVISRLDQMASQPAVRPQIDPAQLFNQPGGRRQHGMLGNPFAQPIAGQEMSPERKALEAAIFGQGTPEAMRSDITGVFPGGVQARSGAGGQGLGPIQSFPYPGVMAGMAEDRGIYTDQARAQDRAPNPLINGTPAGVSVADAGRIVQERRDSDPFDPIGLSQGRSAGKTQGQIDRTHYEELRARASETAGQPQRTWRDADPDLARARDWQHTRENAQRNPFGGASGGVGEAMMAGILGQVIPGFGRAYGQQQELGVRQEEAAANRALAERGLGQEDRQIALQEEANRFGQWDSYRKDLIAQNYPPDVAEAEANRRFPKPQQGNPFGQPQPGQQQPGMGGGPDLSTPKGRFDYESDLLRKWNVPGLEGWTGFMDAYKQNPEVSKAIMLKKLGGPGLARRELDNLRRGFFNTWSESQGEKDQINAMIDELIQSLGV